MKYTPSYLLLKKYLKFTHSLCTKGFFLNANWQTNLKNDTCICTVTEDNVHSKIGNDQNIKEKHQRGRVVGIVIL